MIINNYYSFQRQQSYESGWYNCFPSYEMQWKQSWMDIRILNGNSLAFTDYYRLIRYSNCIWNDENNIRLYK